MRRITPIPYVIEVDPPVESDKPDGDGTTWVDALGGIRVILKDGRA